MILIKIYIFLFYCFLGCLFVPFFHHYNLELCKKCKLYCSRKRQIHGEISGIKVLNNSKYKNVYHCIRLVFVCQLKRDFCCLGCAALQKIKEGERQIRCG